jgi:hypothetical protein
VQPSSLIFLILIAIWAAYLLQHWIRRREHLATARSVDRFSDAMRVLERRSMLPDLAVSAPRPRSYAVSPARPSRPEVVVKCAQTVKPEVQEAPAVARTHPPVRPTRVVHARAGVSARRVRGLSLLASFLLALVVSPLAALSLLPWWSALVVAATLMADVFVLRLAAVSERSAGRAEARARRSASGPAPAAARRPAYFDAESESRVESDIESEYDAETPYDAQAPVARSVEMAQPTQAPAEVDPSGWAPVPVPPPTYTLKAKAADHVPAPAQFTELEDEEGWSLDGLVYDCDLDELVQRRSATGA